MQMHLEMTCPTIRRNVGDVFPEFAFQKKKGLAQRALLLVRGEAIEISLGSFIKESFYVAENA